MRSIRRCCRTTARSVTARRSRRASSAWTICRLPITDLESAERWQKVLNQMNSGDMPPEDEKQPDRAAKANFLDDLANVMVAARRDLGDQHGVITMRRLNRREYRNTLRELLGVEINVSELPSDTGTGGFDTVGSNLFMSGNQFEQYQSLGREALDEAFERQASGCGGEEAALRSGDFDADRRQVCRPSNRRPGAGAAMGEGRGGSGGAAGERGDRRQDPQGVEERRDLPPLVGEDSRRAFAAIVRLR